mmetsp:Transcript_88749/g.231688  ORF Transcript_88749/g.231688 Transcript_88749/m.231688 type:complete len:200 (+) Transcript_88749:581-1180(+)
MVAALPQELGLLRGDVVKRVLGCNHDNQARNSASLIGRIVSIELQHWLAASHVDDAATRLEKLPTATIVHVPRCSGPVAVHSIGRTLGHCTRPSNTSLTATGTVANRGRADQRQQDGCRGNDLLVKRAVEHATFLRIEAGWEGSTVLTTLRTATDRLASLCVEGAPRAQRYQALPRWALLWHLSAPVRISKLHFCRFEA